MTAIQPINQGPGSNAFPSNVRGIAGPLMIALLIRVGWEVLMRLFSLVGIPLWRILPRQVMHYTPTLIGLVAVILYFIWGVRVINTLRARGEMTNFSPGFSVGAWFIPFANFVFPGLILADIWRRATRSPAGIVALWWCIYVLFTLLDTGFEMMINSGGFHGGAVFFNVLNWLTWLTDVGAYGLWYLIVRRVTESLENPPPAGGAPAYGAPMMGNNIQRS